MIGALWTYMMENRFERAHRKQCGSIADVPRKQFYERTALVSRFKVYHAGNGISLVEDLKGVRCVVELDLSNDSVSCESGYWLNHDACWEHMISAARWSGSLGVHQQPLLYGHISQHVRRGSVSSQHQQPRARPCCEAIRTYQTSW